jgi:DNA helicase-2/ATP-dependent DNA helicase PcrA
MTRIWSPQQQTFLDWCATGYGSCQLEAVAGAGKTTTVVAAAPLLRGQVAYIVYNKKNGDELDEKLRAAGLDWKKAQGGTVHKFGLGALRKSFPKIKIAGKDGVPGKIVTILEEQLVDRTFAGPIEKMIGLAKQRALGLPGCGAIDDTAQWLDIIDHFDILDMLEDGLGNAANVAYMVRSAIDGLKASNAQTDVCDFDDMIYLPCLLNCRFWQFDAVVMDEDQDANQARIELAARLLKRGGRFIGVGDSRQAIYGFTGAENDAIDRIVKRFNCQRLSLTVSYRCPKAVVRPSPGSGSTTSRRTRRRRTAR